MEEKIEKNKNRTTALLLCIFGGFLGLHKFYEEKIVIGILYMCTFGLFCVGWIVDIIKYFKMQDDSYSVEVNAKKTKKYVRKPCPKCGGYNYHIIMQEKYNSGYSRTTGKVKYGLFSAKETSNTYTSAPTVKQIPMWLCEDCGNMFKPK